MKPKLSAQALLSEYARAVDPAYLEHIEARMATFRYNLGQIRSYLRPGQRILEVGSYCGAFLKVAQQVGLDITGVEPSAWAVRASSEITDVPVVNGTTSDLPRDSEPFDVVVSWDVLEHFADPVTELREMHRILSAEGTLVFSTLMIDNWFPRATGKHWPWLMDMHLFYFTESSIRNVLARTGFEVVESSRYCHIVTLGYLLSKLGTLGVPLSKRLSSVVTGTPLGKAEIPFRFGDIKLFVCRKRPVRGAPNHSPRRDGARPHDISEITATDGESNRQAIAHSNGFAGYGIRSQTKRCRNACVLT
jgi:2-polyprenyl-3-methyl-5-hydroxy-6-metoxy-1,4-benzoquinol methylase